MTSETHVASYGHRRKITDPEVIRIAREYENDPTTPSAKETLQSFYAMMGMDIELDEIFAD